MLRITLHDNSTGFRLRLEGRLAGPWVREVELCWQTAEPVIRNRALIVDLRDVDFVDAAGEQLLAAMHQHGAEFLAASAMTKHLVRQITGEPVRTPGQPVPPPRKARLRLRLLSLFLIIAAAGWPAELPAPDEALARYLSAARLAARNPSDVLADVAIDAKLPRLHKRGTLRALQLVSRSGSVSYRPVHFEGDLAIEKNVIARYLSIEQDARTRDAGSLAVTPANYRFHFERLSRYNGAIAYVFRLDPKRKRSGLFRGELWVDSETFLPLRQWGVMVKSPSLFVKSIYFVQDYTTLGGRSFPLRTIVNVDTRLVGTAELTIWFDLRCASVKEKPQPLDLTLLGTSDVGFSSPIVGSNACTL